MKVINDEWRRRNGMVRVAWRNGAYGRHEHVARQCCACGDNNEHGGVVA